MCWIWILKLANRFLCSTDDKAKEICPNISQVETKTTDMVTESIAMYYVASYEK